MKIKELKDKIRAIEDLQRKIKSMVDIKNSDFGDIKKVPFMIFDVWVELALNSALVILDVNLDEQSTKLAAMMGELNVEAEPEVTDE